VGGQVPAAALRHKKTTLFTVPTDTLGPRLARQLRLPHRPGDGERVIPLGLWFVVSDQARKTVMLSAVEHLYYQW
jgi:hypothetical protein